MNSFAASSDSVIIESVWPDPCVWICSIASEMESTTLMAIVRFKNSVSKSSGIDCWICFGKSVEMALEDSVWRLRSSHRRVTPAVNSALAMGGKWVDKIEEWSKSVSVELQAAG